MGLIAKSGTPSLATKNPPDSCRVGSGLIVGENVGAVDACYIASDGSVKRSLASINAPPAAPTVAANGAGSAFGAGTYFVAVAYKTARGESTPSPQVATILTAGQNLRVSAIGGGALDASITSVEYYVDGEWEASTAVVGGTAAQTDLTGATPATGRAPQTINTAFKSGAYRVAGFSAIAGLFAQLDAITLYQGVDFRYGAALTPGVPLWVDTATAGGLTDVNPGYGVPPVAETLDATRIRVYRGAY